MSPKISRTRAPYERKDQCARETTSRRGNDYTTFKLRDPNGSEVLNVFTWGHPTLGNGDCVLVEGVFEVEHHQGQYTFRNELEATKLTPCP